MQFWFNKLKSKLPASLLRRPQRLLNRFWMAVFLMVAVVFLLRIINWNFIFTNGAISLAGADAYYFQLQADLWRDSGLNMQAENPSVCYPLGLQKETTGFGYQLGLALLNPIIPKDVAAAFSGPVLAALTALVIVLIGIELVGKDKKWYALMGGFLFGLTGIQYWARSYFGYGDRHALEVFLMAMVILTLLKVQKLWSWQRTLAVFLATGIYLITWNGAGYLILLFLLAIWASSWKVVPDSPKLQSYVYAGIAIMISLWGLWAGNQFFVWGGVGVAALIAAQTFAPSIVRRQENFIYFHATIFALCFLILIILFATNAPIARQVLAQINDLFNNWQINTTISEQLPMWMVYAQSQVFDMPGVQIILFIISLLGLYRLGRKHSLWLAQVGIVIAFLTVMRIRMEYYYQIWIALAWLALICWYWRLWFVTLVACIIFPIFFWQTLLSPNRAVLFTHADHEITDYWLSQGLDAPVLANWELGYYYAYNSQGKMQMLAAPNLCNFNLPAQFFTITHESVAVNFLKEKGIKYVVVRLVDLSRWLTYYQTMQVSAPQVLSTQVKGTNYYLIPEDYYRSMGMRMWEFPEAYSAKDPLIYDGEQIYDPDTSDVEGKIYSINPNVTPVDLPALTKFKLVKSTGSGDARVLLYELID